MNANLCNGDEQILEFMVDHLNKHTCAYTGTATLPDWGPINSEESYE
jgi:hypothetical protein